MEMRKVLERYKKPCIFHSYCILVEVFHSNNKKSTCLMKSADW